MYFLTREITSKKVDGKNVDILTSEITLEKVRGNKCIFEPSKLHRKKVRENDMDFSISKIISKKYAEMTRKFVETWFSTYRSNISVESLLFDVVSLLVIFE